MEKILENLNYKILNYFVFLIIFITHSNEASVNKNLILLIFLYFKDIIYTNPYLNNIFLKNYKFLKSKINFFKLIFETSYIILIFYFISFLIIYFFFNRNLSWLILIIPFSVINSVIFILTNKIIQRLNIFSSCFILLMYALLFENYKFEVFFAIICIIEIIFFIFFSKYKFKKIYLLKIKDDMRAKFFLRKLLINLVFSQFLKIIFVMLMINIYFFYNFENIKFIFYFVLIIEIGDLFGNFIKKKFWKILETNFIIQKNSNKYFKKIFKSTSAYFFIGVSLIYFMNQYFYNYDFLELILFIIIFLSYNFEKVKNLILLTMDRSILYKKHFTFNFINILLVIFIINLIFFYEQSVLILKFLIFYFIILEIINIRILEKYINYFKR